MIRCPFCQTSVPDVDAAVEAEWIPSFFVEDDEIHDPVCPRCAASRLESVDGGELELARHVRLGDEAQSAERGRRWLDAAVLWHEAAEVCRDDARAAYYRSRGECARGTADRT